MGTRATSYQALSVTEGDRLERLKKDGTSRQQTRLRYAFLLMCLLLPPVLMLLALDGGSASADTWKPAPRKDVMHWRPTHHSYVRELKERGKDLRLVFYGDSITESWRGTSRLKPVPRAAGIPEVWNETIGRVYGDRAAAYGISGDYTKHLMWRLQNGEVTREMKPRVVVLLIGTNDLSECELMQDDCHLDAAAALEVSNHTLGIARLLHKRFLDARVVLHALMPRASRFAKLEEEDHQFYEQPSLFSEPIATINAALQSAALDLPWASFLDCSEAFLSEDKGRIDSHLMPDGLHPGSRGAAKWAECLMPHLRKLDPTWDHWPVGKDDTADAAVEGPA